MTIFASLTYDIPTCVWGGRSYERRWFGWDILLYELSFRNIWDCLCIYLPVSRFPTFRKQYVRLLWYSIRYAVQTLVRITMLDSNVCFATTASINHGFSVRLWMKLEPIFPLSVDDGDLDLVVNDLCCSCLCWWRSFFCDPSRGYYKPGQIDDAAVFVNPADIWYHFFVNDPHPEKPVHPKSEIVFGLDSVH